MEDSIFRDYCKAENSDDEEANRDLQSHLYAKIYYASNDIENVDTKSNIKLETPSIFNEEFYNRVDTSTTFSNNSWTNNVTRDYKNVCATNDSVLTEEINKCNVKPIYIENQTEILDINNKSNFKKPFTIQHSQGNSEMSQNNKGLINQRVGIDNLDSCNINTDVSIKPEVENKSEVEELKSTNLSVEVNESIAQSYLKSTICHVDNNAEKLQEIMYVAKTNSDHDNILKKYEFSKSFINRLYQKKYQNLQQQLQKLEEQKEISLREKEQKEKDKRNNTENQQLDTRIGFMNQTKSDSRYSILAKNKKQQRRTDHFNEEVLLLSSDVESDSEKSILEVPIPPKPKPPVINLQDSDEESDTVSSNTDTEEFIIENEYNEKTLSTNLGETNSANYRLINDITEDIMLNCTEIQKGVSTIKEIKEMSKNVQNTLECYNKNENVSEKNKSPSTSTLYNKNFNKTKMLLLNEKDNTSVCQLPMEPTNNSNIVYERDKNKKLICSMEDVTNFENSNEASSSRKRQRENDNECSVNAKHKKHSYIEDKCSGKHIDQHKGKVKNKSEVWEDYFFRPMSESLKTFYNEPRGQENFDVQEIQSNMSKDPRLWAILDEDLIPNLSRKNRFWNVKCNNCDQTGHQLYNCPYPRKPARCHMCGTQGHTETRCPQKMCLTCGKKQGTFRKTCEFCRTLYCNMCKAIGHKSTECPDLWRRFHQTTRNSEINIPENLSEVMKPADLLYCCNCTKRGHDSSTCHDYRWSQHFPTPAFVSSYTDGPSCENSIRTNTMSEDIIPLVRSKTSKKNECRNVMFPQGSVDIPSNYILYSYGTFHTTKPNGQEVDRKLEKSQFDHLKKYFPPTFLNELIKTVKFEILIYHSLNGELRIRIRSTTGNPTHIYNIFMFWLNVKDEGKQLHLYVDIPRDSTQMFKFLTTKWIEMEQNLRDPNTLYKQIEELKKSKLEVRDPVKLKNISEKIASLCGKLIYISHVKPSLSRHATGLRGIMRKLIRIKQNSKSGQVDFNDKWYLRTVTTYNELFLPRTLTNPELRRFLHRYSNKKIEDKSSKKQKKAVERFIATLKNCKSMLRQREKSTNANNNNTLLSKVNNEQSKQKPTVTSIETFSASNVQQSNSNPYNVVPSEECQIGETINTECNYVYPIKVVELTCNTNISNNTTVEGTVKRVQSKSVRSNLTVISTKTPPSCSNTLMQPDKTNLNNVSCTEIKTSENNSEENTVTTKHNNEQQSQQENTINSETSITKKKRNKKKKVKPENSSQVMENKITNVHPSVEDKARRAISEALQFNLPYMNKAVDEIRKRLSDETIKQEHIDVLQRLINLEKDHRQYLSSFCTYLH
ncbi:uncharacterized protein LOC116429614 [Nomia melanderi]|uniref:uncharacterized protein LOC116429614 n=1 Tax=Nomia melanderi TaxID=2448451 RepID=UPI0013044571|nr:uncharacterized protein LOC116429614 [Nomia melanderi]XP_031838600.1 uncharacterized protein LOC116429614 [Nomia melanderi]XP_031838601.1 uncharacterized protein LOC116429614 [Nomia melanderi]XP_031838602.1 uncharacterized protein LOC116429614 [Nomia melanderi]